MDSLVRDTYLWAITLELTKAHGFQRLDLQSGPKESLLDHLSSVERPILLFRNIGRKYQLIRLQATDYVWPSMLARDIRHFADQVPLLRKRLKAAEVRIENIYLLSYPADNFHEAVFNKMAKIEEGKSEVFSSAFTVPKVISNSFELEFSHLGIGKERLTPAITQHVITKPLWELKRAVEAEEQRKEKEFNQVFHYGKPILTYILLFINLLAFAFLELVGSSTDVQTLIKYGAKWNPSLIAGEYWRFFTPMFLHIGFLHIIFNGLALYFLGGLVERIYGSFRFFWIYLFSGFMGVAASFAFTDNVAAGASGAIFGCFGAMLYFGLKRKDLFFRTLGSDIIFVLLFNLGIGAAIPMIDNYAHVGGLIGGFLAAMLVHLPQQHFIKERVTALGTSLVLALLLIQIGFGKGLDSPMYHLIQADLEVKQENWSAASSHLERAIQLGNHQSEVYLQLGMLYNQQEKYEQAEQTLLEAKQRGNDQSELYFHLAYAQLQQHKLEEGRLNLLETIERDSKLVEAYYNLALVYLELNQREKALEIIEQAEQLHISTPLLKELQQKILDMP